MSNVVSMEEFKDRKRPMKECGVCGLMGLKKEMLKSRHTLEFYCTDLGACAMRAVEGLRE